MSYYEQQREKKKRMKKRAGLVDTMESTAGPVESLFGERGTPGAPRHD